MTESFKENTDTLNARNATLSTVSATIDKHWFFTKLFIKLFYKVYSGTIPAMAFKATVASRLRSLRSDDPLSKPHPRSIEQELET